jgi:TPP-dependent pyruvate/acetoin dehydrogenase alpha subunit
MMAGVSATGNPSQSLNWAKIYELPVLFMCEDNGFAASTRTRAMSAGPGPDARAESLGIPARAIDGNDVIAVDQAAGELLTRVRAGAGPQFLLARTYRLKGHTASDVGAYRPAAEVEARKADDPLKRAAEMLRLGGIADEKIISIDCEARAVIAAAWSKAMGAPWPAAELAFTDVQDVGAPSWR